MKVGGALLALILLENGRQIPARISQLSANGGLLALDRPLDEGIKVTVVFHIGSTSVRSRAEMLFPMWATKGCLQPFRLRDLEQPLRSALRQELDALVSARAPQQNPDGPELLTGSAFEQSAETPQSPQESALFSEGSELAPQEETAQPQQHELADSFMGEQPPESPSPNISAAPQSAPE